MVTHIMTHNDLDAVGCVVVVLASEQKIGTLHYHGYDTIDSALLDFINNKKYSPGDTLLIADITPTQGTLIAIDANRPTDLNMVLLDHHKTRLWANKLSWAKVDVTKAAVELVFDWCHVSIPSPKSVYFLGLVHAIAAWDTWRLECPHRARGENLNTLLTFIGKDRFVALFSKDPAADGTPNIEEMIKVMNSRRKRYVTQVIKTQLANAKYHKDGFGQVFKIIYANEYVSEIGHAALDDPEHEDLHYICVVDPISGSCSLRSRTGEVDVGTVAKRLGGGGHQAAAGFGTDFKEHIEETVYRMLLSIDDD
jgi:oligoribonuclease NrnB/cAMP/cGMP phosphodiesterase (DHH superfamily)